MHFISYLYTPYTLQAERICILELGVTGFNFEIQKRNIRKRCPEGIGHREEREIWW